MQEVLIKAVCYIGIIFMGFTLRKRGFFGEHAFGVITSIVMKITLPAAIISGSSGKTIPLAMLSIMGLSLGSGILYMLISATVYRNKSKEKRAFAILNTPGYNIGNFALPFTQSFLGSMGVVTCSLFDMGNAFICLGGAYGVAAAVKDGKGFDAGRILRSLVHSMPLLAHMMMVFLNLMGWVLPGPILTFAGIVGQGNTFLALLMIGVGFRLTGEREQIGDIARIVSIRYSIAMVLALIFYFVLPFELEVRQALVILALSPISSAVPGFTAELKSDVGLSSAVSSVCIVISTVLIVLALLIMV